MCINADTGTSCMCVYTCACMCFKEETTDKLAHAQETFGRFNSKHYKSCLWRVGWGVVKKIFRLKSRLVLD